MARTAQNSTNLAIESRLPVVELQGGILTNYPVVVNNSLKVQSLNLTDSTVAISGSTAATLGDLGGATGPQTAAQNSWLQVEINGSNYFIPLWK